MKNIGIHSLIVFLSPLSTGFIFLLELMIITSLVFCLTFYYLIKSYKLLIILLVINLLYLIITSFNTKVGGIQHISNKDFIKIDNYDYLEEKQTWLGLFDLNNLYIGFNN